MKIHYFFSIFSIFSLFADSSADPNTAKISEAMGHLIGKNLEHLGLDLDIEAVITGLKNASQGKNSPMQEEECMEAIASLQEAHLEKIAEKNRKEAEDFLKTHQKEKGVVSLEEGKIQYKITKQGDGQAVAAYNSPIVRYTAHYLDGQSLGPSPDEELVRLDETILGFSKGIIGMKEGEIRTIYLHPDMAYGKNSHLLPDALLIFEVELIKADGCCDLKTSSGLDDELPRKFQDFDIDKSLQ